MASTYLELLDWRRLVAELFAELRRRPADAATLNWFRAEKDALFKHHSQSPIPVADRAKFQGLSYWPYDPRARVSARFTEQQEPDQARHATQQPSQNEPAREPTSQPSQQIAFRPIGALHFELNGTARALPAFWIEGYAGGLFVPFKDTTSGHQTYGGGRYLLDTIKSADLGSDTRHNSVVLDFNYAYHPSCTYDPVWVCPLAPPDSRLDVPVHAGERL